MPTIDSVITDFADAVGAKDAVAVEGGRTRWSSGGPAAEGVRLVRAPEGIAAHQPEELTVRVRAGTSVAELHAALARAGQRTALPERGGTVGGAVAVGENDYRVLGRGTVRSAVLQVRYISHDGRIISAGGPTVKNVSGFDLPKMIVGSLGTLGLVAEVTLRTNPIPPLSIWLCCDDTNAFAVRDALLAPSAVLWNGTSTWVLLEGHPPDVQHQSAVLAAIGRFEEVEGPPAFPVHRWSLRPADLRALRQSGTTNPASGDFIASVGVGTVFATQPRPASNIDPGIMALSTRLKNAFDPSDRLNPGRSPGSN